MFCKNCGKEIDDNLKICPNCKANLNEGNEMQGKLVLDKKKVIIICSIIVVILAMAAVFLIAFNAGKISVEGTTATNTAEVNSVSETAENTTETTTSTTTTTTTKAETTKAPVIKYSGTDIPSYCEIFGVAEEIVPTDTVIFRHYSNEADYQEYVKILKECGFKKVDSIDFGDVYENDRNTVTISAEYDDNGNYYVYVCSEDLWGYFNSTYK